MTDGPKPRLFIHVGPGKSGTTWLQQQLFPNLPGVNYLGRFWDPDTNDNYKSEVAYTWLYDLVLGGDQAEKEGYLDEGALFFRKCAHPRLPNLLSHEIILLPYLVLRAAQRLAAITRGFDTHIIISIRRQDKIAFSKYMADMKNYGTVWKYDIHEALDASQDARCRHPYCKYGLVFDANLCTCAEERVKKIPLWQFNYLGHLRLFEHVFGKGKVHLIISEHLSGSLNGLAELERLEKFLGIEVPPGFNREMIEKPKKNVANKSMLYSNLLAKYQEGDPSLAERVLAFFKQSNQELAQATGLPLQELQYF